MNYLIVCLVIGLVLLIHESGHFISAMLNNIPIRKFSIGFGPKLWSFTRGDTEFCLSLIPLGGYVMPHIESEDDFYQIPPMRRILFSLGGPLANLLSVIPLLAFFNIATKGFSIAGAFIHPIIQTGLYIQKIIDAIPLLFDDPQQISGVVGIVSQGGQAAGLGLPGILALAAFLSVNLAVLNLLPIPALDGGQVLLTIIERVWPRSVKIRIPLSLLGWLFLIGTMVYATSKDVSRLLG